jgi:hypothetical protein
MAKNLSEYLETHRANGFRPAPHYFAQGDFVTYYFRNDPCYAERVDDLLTVFLTFDTKELVGCKIKGVKHILQTAGNFGVALNDGDLRLGMFFFVGAALAKDEAQRSRYEQIGEKAKEAVVDRRELEAVEAVSP